MIMTLIQKDADRINIGPKMLGGLMPYLRFETTVFSLVEKFTSEYKGESWNFYSLPEGGFFMAPNTDQEFNWNNPNNYSSGKISADVLGIICCLYAFSQLGKYDLYHILLEATQDHPESSMIFAAID